MHLSFRIKSKTQTAVMVSLYIIDHNSNNVSSVRRSEGRQDCWWWWLCYHHNLSLAVGEPGGGGCRSAGGVSWREAQLACSELVLPGCEDLSRPGTF